MALQHPLHVHLPLPRNYRHRLPALQVPHPRPHTTRPPHAEAVQPQKDVRLGWRRDKAVSLYPAPLHQPLTHTFLPCYRPHRRLTRPSRYGLSQPRRCPSSRPASGVWLREHLAAVPAAEATLEERQPDLLLPEPGIPLSLQVPLLDLPCGATAPGAVCLLRPVLPNNFYPVLFFFHFQHLHSG